MNTLYNITTDLFEANDPVTVDDAESLIDGWSNDYWEYSIDTMGDELRIYVNATDGDDDETYEADNAPGSYFTMVDNHYGYLTIGEAISITSAEQDIIDILKNEPCVSNAQLAYRLNKSENTIRNQFASIYEKFGIENKRGHDSRLLFYDLIGWITTN